MASALWGLHAAQGLCIPIRKDLTICGKIPDKVELSLVLGRTTLTAVTDKLQFLNSLTNKHYFVLVARCHGEFGDPGPSILGYDVFWPLEHSQFRGWMGKVGKEGGLGVV